MASKTENLNLAAVIRGQGKTSRCRVSATKVWSAGTTEYQYIRVDVMTVETLLPDGDYELLMDGRVFPVKLEHGRWSSAS
jgi:hypothetical protein